LAGAVLSLARLGRIFFANHGGGNHGALF
jgi:hypothetical protein